MRITSITQAKATIVAPAMVAATFFSSTSSLPPYVDAVVLYPRASLSGSTSRHKSFARLAGTTGGVAVDAEVLSYLTQHALSPSDVEIVKSEIVRLLPDVMMRTSVELDPDEGWSTLAVRLFSEHLDLAVVQNAENKFYERAQSSDSIRAILDHVTVVFS
jgi:hypothetical protein